MMCSKHKTTKKWKPQKYPQRRKLFSSDTLRRINKILFCQNSGRKNRKCNKYIPVRSPERQKHHIIPLSEGGTNNYTNIIVCCIECHFSFHQDAFLARGLTLEQFRASIYSTHQENKRRNKESFLIDVGRRGLGFLPNRLK